MYAQAEHSMGKFLHNSIISHANCSMFSQKQSKLSENRQKANVVMNIGIRSPRLANHK